MRVLLLTPDAFGGHGGIAQYNRDFLRALCAHPACQEVVAVPRYIPNPIEALPHNISYVTTGAKGKLSYAAAVFRTVHRNPQFDLIICGLSNLLPLAFLLAPWTRA